MPALTPCPAEHETDARLDAGPDTRPALPDRRRWALRLAGGLLLTQLPACATEPAGAQGPVSLAIIDRDSKQMLTEYRKDGRAYVAGRPDTRYGIRLSNRSAGRVLVVLSVDGVNVVTGETAAYGQSGYVLNPWQTADIAGWRKSDTAVAAFVFAALADSYAARTGRPDNVGVIGMAVFLEKPAPPPPPPPAPPVAPPVASSMSPPMAASPAGRVMAEASSNAKAATQDRAASPPPPPPAMRSLAPKAEAERLGTAHGQREWSVSRRTTFDRLSRTPQQVVEIAYDSHANLVLAGVIPAPPAQARAFPRDAPEPGFVPDPPAR